MIATVSSEPEAPSIMSIPLRQVKNWILKYQQLFQFYLTYHHCEVPRKDETATLALGVVPKNQIQIRQRQS
jgi:hypothetical protein